MAIYPETPKKFGKAAPLGRFEGTVMYKKALVAVDTAGGAAAIANPEGVALAVKRLLLYVTTKSTAAGTVSAGIAANGTTSAANLIDTLDVGTAAGLFDNITNPGTNGKAGQLWGASQYLTVSKASGALAGLVGFVEVEYAIL